MVEVRVKAMSLQSVYKFVQAQPAADTHWSFS